MAKARSGSCIHGAPACGSCGHGPAPSAVHFSVTTWNLLARSYTHHLLGHHGGDWWENETQTCQRYELAAREILRLKSDVVCLQELEDTWFQGDWNWCAKELNNEYYQVAWEWNSPGTSVLLRASSSVQRFGKLIDSNCCGAAVASLMVGGFRLMVVSAHLHPRQWKSLPQLQQVGEHLKGETLVVFAGDFNCVPERGCSSLEQKTFLGGMYRASLQKGATTALSKDRKTRVCIDHVYFRNSALETCGPGQTQEHAIPYEAGHVIRASDHSPVTVRFRLKPDACAAGGTPLCESIG